MNQEASIDPVHATRPWLVRWVASEDTAHTALWRLRGEAARQGLFVGSLRSWKMRERAGVFEQFSALMQFPRYFGESWNAFVDCVGDLDWLHSTAIFLVLLDAPELLSNGDPDEFGLLLRVLEDCAESFSQANEFRTAQPFHVVLHATPERAAALDSRLAAEQRLLPLVQL